MPSFTYQPLTELEAINMMLENIGESPVSNLETSGDLYVSVARQMLYNASREIQTRGWYFNTEENYPLPINGSNEVVLASNVLGVDLTDDFYIYDAVLRGNKLYNRKTHSYVFDKDLKGDITLFLEWSNLPQPARQYIAVVAARRFQKKYQPDDYTTKVTADEEITAKSDLEDYDANTRDYNMADNYSVFNILER
jgi:hypothetical protein